MICNSKWIIPATLLFSITFLNLSGMAGDRHCGALPKQFELYPSSLQSICGDLGREISVTVDPAFNHGVTSDRDFRSDCFFENGIPNGIWTIRYASGNLAAEIPFVNGHLSGEFKFYDTEGVVLDRIQLLNNELHGLYFITRDMGKKTLTVSTHFERGHAIGPAKICGDDPKSPPCVEYKDVYGVLSAFRTGKDFTVPAKWKPLHDSR